MESISHSGNSSSTSYSFLPSFLMGEPECVTPRINSIASNKGGKNMPFNSTSLSMPLDNHSINQPLSPISPLSPLQSQNYHQQQNVDAIQNLNVNMNGPPTKSLFDALQNDQNILQIAQPETIKTHSTVSRPPYGTPIPAATALYHMQSASTSVNYNDSYLNKSITFNPNSTRPLQSLNASIADSNNSLLYQIDATTRLEPNTTIEYTLQPRDYWITIFGFPPAAVPSILDHFTQCGIIVDKKFPKQSGNWLHLRYKSRIECEKALSFNEKIINNNLMIGVTSCKDPEIYDKENTTEIFSHTERFMPIAQQEYMTVKNALSPTNSHNTPGRNNRFVNKAMDLLFGW